MSDNGKKNPLLRKIFLVDLLEGLWLTLRYELAVGTRLGKPKELCTEQYPQERPEVSERYRGAPRLNINPETGETLCISCDLCALACPQQLIVVSHVRVE